MFLVSWYLGIGLLEIRFYSFNVFLVSLLTLDMPCWKLDFSITWAVRHWVLKWAVCVCVGGGSTSGLDADWLVHGERNVGFSCLSCLYGLFVGMLLSATNTHTDCGRHTLSFIERFWLGSVRAVCVCSNYVREILSLQRRSWEPSWVPFKELSCVFKKNRKSSLLILDITC